MRGNRILMSSRRKTFIYLFILLIFPAGILAARTNNIQISCLAPHLCVSQNVLHHAFLSLLPPHFKNGSQKEKKELEQVIGATFATLRYKSGFLNPHNRYLVHSSPLGVQAAELSEKDSITSPGNDPFSPHNFFYYPRLPDKGRFLFHFTDKMGAARIIREGKLNTVNAGHRGYNKWNPRLDLTEQMTGFFNFKYPQAVVEGLGTLAWAMARDMSKRSLHNLYVVVAEFNNNTIRDKSPGLGLSDIAKFPLIFRDREQSRAFVVINLSFDELYVDGLVEEFMESHDRQIPDIYYPVVYDRLMQTAIAYIWTTRLNQGIAQYNNSKEKPEWIDFASLTSGSYRNFLHPGIELQAVVSAAPDTNKPSAMPLHAGLLGASI